LINHDSSESENDEMHLQSDESEFVMNESQPSESTSTTVAEFLDETPGSSWSVENNITSNLSDRQPEVELAKFLSRPVLIKTHVWAQTDSFATTTTWNPWNLFFNSTPIKSKLNNYAYIHCKLKLKFVINASPFYSGAMYFAYSPLQNLNGNSIITDASAGELIPYSQRPGVWVFPQTCQGGEITLPFFYHKNWLDITSNQDTIDMGTITPCLYAALVSATGITGTSVVVNVYAWAEDVKLHAPTTKLALQSSEFDYKPSQIASATASAASALSRIPMIGPYMKATSSVMGTMSKVASSLGFTNVPNMETVSAYKPMPFPHASSCEVSVPNERSAVDPKNEVSLDPRTVGLDGKDELDLSYIAGRESYIGTAILSSTDAVDTLSMVSRVTPAMLFSQNFLDTTKPIQYTPMGYVANMFKYWRGDIIFRFKFICTRFHKGRVRITWDPINNISTTVPDYTTVFNEIVDIGAEQDLEIRVPYAQALTFMRSDSNLANYNFQGTALSPDPGYDNGLITMRVVNPLSGPIATTAIPVLVFVRAADNIEFAHPFNRYIAYLHAPYALQSKEVEYSVSPRQVIAGNAVTTGDPNKYLVHFGECIKSFRPLLHRYSRQYTLQTAALSTVNTLNIWTHTTSRRLKYPGFSTNAYWTANKVIGVGTAPYNFIRSNIHQLVSLLFVGQRGSMNHMFNIEATISTGHIGFSNVTLARYDNTITPSTDFNKLDTNTSTSISNQASIALTYQLDPQSGIALTDQRLQPSINMNFPYYSSRNFQFVNPQYADKGSTVDGTDLDNVRLQVCFLRTQDARPFTVNAYTSFGPDYNFFFFLNCPSLYRTAIPTGV
jgi:hypothetical protein